MLHVVNVFIYIWCEIICKFFRIQCDAIVIKRRFKQIINTKCPSRYKLLWSMNVYCWFFLCYYKIVMTFNNVVIFYQGLLKMLRCLVLLIKLETVSIEKSPTLSALTWSKNVPPKGVSSKSMRCYAPKNR